MDDKEKCLSIQTRRRAREAALQALYQCDTLGEVSAAQVQQFFNHFFPESVAATEGGSCDNYLFSRRLVLGVIAEISAVDRAISSASVHWSVSRMPRVDRNILRVAVYELLFVSDVPSSVVINEAIEVAKRFSNPDSATFINGVLDAIAKSHRPLPAATEQTALGADAEVGSDGARKVAA